MDFLKKFWENPLLKKLIIGTGIFLLIIIFLMMFASCSSKGRVYSYDEIEKILIQKTKAAYGKSSNLPSLNQKIDISIEELVNKTKKHNKQNLYNILRMKLPVALLR